MEEIRSLFLRKGFLLESELNEIFREVDKSISEDFVDAVTTSIKEKIISKKAFLENIDKINKALNQKSEEKPESKTLIKKAIKFFSSLLPAGDEPKDGVEVKKDVAEKFSEKTKGFIEISKELSATEKQKKKQQMQQQEKINQQIQQIGQITSVNDDCVIKNYIIPSKKFSVDDFTEHFKNRLNLLKEILQNKTELENLISISKLSKAKQNASVIGIIFAKNRTKNKNILLKVEDLTGQISVLISHEKEELFQKAENLVEDDVIGINCVGTSEILFANDIILPEISARKKFAEKEEYASFISDLHVGSKNFLEREFLNFIKWLNLGNGSDSQKEMAKKVKYLFIVGDTVDGVGVFPGQEKLLAIPDLKEQYKRLSELLSRIRNDIKIFLCPGQHDASRLAEPQPPVSPVYAQELYNIKNLYLVSNPALITVGKTGSFPGLKVLMYHGASFHNLINELDELRMSNAYDNPTKIIKVLLKKRHLAPSHYFTTYLPADEDSLLIREIPDIVTTGELHRAEISNYKNILLVASSCWQSITPFEEKVGNHPEPCKVPILNLKTGEAKIIDFS